MNKPREEFINDEQWEEYLLYEFMAEAYLLSLLEDEDEEMNEETRYE